MRFSRAALERRIEFLQRVWSCGKICRTSGVSSARPSSVAKNLARFNTGRIGYSSGWTFPSNCRAARSSSAVLEERYVVASDEKSNRGFIHTAHAVNGVYRDVMRSRNTESPNSWVRYSCSFSSASMRPSVSSSANALSRA